MSSGRLASGFDWRAGVLGGIAIYGLLLLAHGGSVAAGNLSNSDDLMRLLQVRDLLSGQGWYDVDQSRFLSPEGGAMHWSRIPDVFISALILLARPFVGQAGAEAFAALAWPGIILVGLTVCLLELVRRMGGGHTGQMAALLAVATFAPIYQFWPGRIDHHGLNALLTAAGLLALTSRGVVSAALAALAAAAMVSVALESLPMAAALIVGAGALWVWRGAEEAVRLVVFGVVLSVAALVFALVDAPGWGAGRAVCDAYGWAHLQAFLIAGAALAGVGILAGRVTSLGVRYGVGAAVGISAIALVAWLGGACLVSPYGAVTGAADEGWLRLVSEAMSLPAKWAASPDVALFYVGPCVVGLIALGWLAWKADAEERALWGVIAAALVLGLVVVVWQVRAMMFPQVLAVVPIGVASGRALMHWWRARGVGPLLMAAAVLVALSPLAWWQGSSVLLGKTEAPVDPVLASPGAALRDCQAKESFDGLAGLPKSRVFTPIDLGAAVMVHTPHDVFVAPYHRNVSAIGEAAEIWSAAPREAHARLLALGADYLIDCEGLSETRAHALRNADGLASRLLAGDVPDWLVPVETGEALSVWAVAPQN